MANSNLPVQIYSNFNTIIDNVTGASGAGKVDLSNVITVGQAAQMYGYENTLNKLSIAMGRVLLAVRPYRSRFGLIENSREEFGQVTRKISYFSGAFESAQDWNAKQDGDTLVDGSSIDHYKIAKRYPLEVWFGGNKVLQKHYTRFRNQLKVAFSNAEDFARFYEGEAIQINNEIQMMKEAENRALVLNHIAGLYHMVNKTGGVKYPSGMARNMTAEYNTKYGTKYTSDELLTTHLKEFTQFFASELKFQSDLLERATELYHAAPIFEDDNNRSLHLWRHTPKADQRLMLASSVLYDMESTVYSEIFHDGYLKPEQAERVPYWIDPTNPLDCSKVVSIVALNVTTGKSGDYNTALSGIKVLGLMFDKAALATCYRQEDVVTTPVNGAGDYYNTYYHWSKDYRADFTENAVLFYMEDTVNPSKASDVADTEPSA